MIEFIYTLYTTRNYWQIQPCRYFHILQFTVTPIRVLRLHESYPGNGFITVSLSLQITNKVFFAQPNSFLTSSSQLFCQLPNPETLSVLCCNSEIQPNSNSNWVRSLGGGTNKNTASCTVACWFAGAEMCLPHICVVTRASRATENTACNTCCIVVWCHNVREAFLCCVCTGHYLATAVSLHSSCFEQIRHNIIKQTFCKYIYLDL
jgi:hypothetical protein